MKKSLILIGLFGVLVFSGCGDKKESSKFTSWDECQKEALEIVNDLAANKINQEEAEAREKAMKKDCDKLTPSANWDGGSFNTKKPTHGMNENTMR